MNVSRKFFTSVAEATLSGPEMDTGRVDPRVGSGRVGSRVRVKADLAGRVGSGRNF